MQIQHGFFLFFLLLLATVSALLVLPLIQYVMGAALLAFVLFPLHTWLSSRTMEIGERRITVGSRPSAALLTAFGIVTAILPLLFFSVILLQTFQSFVEELSDSDVTRRIFEVGREFGIDEELMVELREEFLSEVEEAFDVGIEMFIQELLRVINVSVRVGVGLLVMVFLLYYFLADGRRLVDWVASVAPVDDEVRKELFSETYVTTWAVMKSHVMIALIEGVLGGLGLYLLGVPNVAFWTFVMIVVSFLPILGIWLVWLPAVGYLIFIGEPASAFLLLVYGITVLSVVDNYLRAFLVNRSSKVHPATVLVGVIGGIYLFGILGLFLGPVLLAVFKGGLEVFSELYQPPEEPSAQT